MKIKNIREVTGSFEILQQTERSQTAVMRLEPGESSSDELNTHPGSDQILLVVEGEVTAEIDGEKGAIKTGDVVIVPAGAKHRFTNSGIGRVLTFTAYGPPAY